MPTGTLVASSITLAADGYNGDRRSFIMSDGRRLAIYGPDTAGQAPYYKTSADGVTWSAASNLPIATGTRTIQAITQNGNVLYCWTADTGSGAIHFNTLTYSTGTQLLTGSTTLDNTFSSYLAQMDAAYDSTHSVLHTAIATNNSVSIIAQPPSASSIATGTSTALFSGTSPKVTGVQCFTTSGTTTVLVLVMDYANSYVIPLTYNGSTYSKGGAETVASGLNVTNSAISLDNANNLDVVYIQGGALYATKRTGTNVYSGQINLASSCGSSGISLVPNGADLVCLYQSVVNQSNGEIYLVWRQSGTWGNPTRFAGGDAGGYSLPKASPVLTSGRLDVVYEASGGVYYYSGTASSAPDAPTITAPSGNETSLTPTITGTYNNSTAPADTQSAVEYKVTRNSDSFVMWDSGKITATSISQVYGTGSNTGDANYVAPTALSYGVAYTLTARCWDSTSTPAVVGPWSGGTVFTPVQGGTVTITQFVDSGTMFTTSPSTIGGSTITSTTVSWSQPQSNAASQYRQTVYANDGVTVISQSAATTIPGNLASGSSYTIGSWTPSGLANSTPYKYEVDLLDSVTNLWSLSAQWTLNTSWIPPAAPTGFTATPEPASGGIVALAWTNNGTGTTVLVQRAPHGTTDWTTLYNGALKTALNDYPKLGVAYDYQVIDVNSDGTQSTPATASNITLGVNGTFGVVITDTISPTVYAWTGVLDQWEDATAWDQPDDVTKYRPLGNTKPILSFSLQDYMEKSGRQFLIPTTGVDANGAVVDQATTIATLRAMRKAHNPCLYRTIDGDYLYVAIYSPTIGYANGMYPMKRATFAVTEVEGPSTPLTS